MWGLVQICFSVCYYVLFFLFFKMYFVYDLYINKAFSRSNGGARILSPWFQTWTDYGDQLTMTWVIYLPMTDSSGDVYVPMPLPLLRLI